MQQIVLFDSRTRDITANNIHRIFLVVGQIFPKIIIKKNRLNIIGTCQDPLNIQIQRLGRETLCLSVGTSSAARGT